MPPHPASVYQQLVGSAMAETPGGEAVWVGGWGGGGSTGHEGVLRTCCLMNEAVGLPIL